MTTIHWTHTAIANQRGDDMTTPDLPPPDQARSYFCNKCGFMGPTDHALDGSNNCHYCAIAFGPFWGAQKVLEYGDARAAAAVLAERERCAKICEAEHVGSSVNDDCADADDAAYNTALRDAAAAIRAEPKKPDMNMTQAATDVLAERQRQIDVENWTPEHDDTEHDDGDLAYAGAAYSLAAGNAVSWYSQGYTGIAAEPPYFWPENWHWKPSNPRRMLVKAAALLLAGIERLDRAKEQQP